MRRKSKKNEYEHVPNGFIFLVPEWSKMLIPKQQSEKQTILCDEEEKIRIVKIHFNPHVQGKNTNLAQRQQINDHGIINFPLTRHSEAILQSIEMHAGIWE